MSELYYIRNKFVGNCALWWREGGLGYTCDLREAGKFTREEAERVCYDRPGEDFMHAVDKVDAIAQMHVDVNRLFQRERIAANVRKMRRGE